MVNILIALLLVAVVAFVMGAWSLIIISRRSPKIYEIEPVVGAIFSDLASLLRNFQKLFYLTTEISQGILKGSDAISGDSPKLVQAEMIEGKQEVNLEKLVEKKSNEDFDNQGSREDSNSVEKTSKAWIGSLIWDKVKGNQNSEEEEKKEEVLGEDSAEGNSEEWTSGEVIEVEKLDIEEDKGTI